MAWVGGISCYFRLHRRAEGEVRTYRRIFLFPLWDKKSESYDVQMASFRSSYEVCDLGFSAVDGGVRPLALPESPIPGPHRAIQVHLRDTSMGGTNGSASARPGTATPCGTNTSGAVAMMLGRTSSSIPILCHRRGNPARKKKYATGLPGRSP